MSSDTDKQRERAILALAATTVLVVSAAAAGVSLATAGTANVAPADITECTTITEPGVYELRANLSVVGETCLTVEASDVAVDGNGYRIERDAPAEQPETMSEYDEPPAVVVGGDATSVRNVTVRNATVVADSLFGLSYSPSLSAAVAYRNASESMLTDVTLWGGRTATPTLRVTGNDNTIWIDAPSSGYVAIDGDRNRLVDSEASVNDDLFEAINVSGRGNVLENVSAHGGPGLAVTGADTVVRNGTFSGVFAPAVELEDAPNSSLIDNTVGGDGGLGVANSSGSEIRGNTLDSGLFVGDSAGIAVLDNGVTEGFTVDGTDDATVRGNVIRGGLELSESASNLIYDNLIVGRAPVTLDEGDEDGASGANRWNVSPRAGENVVGGDTVAGNYYGTDAGTGFSQTCENADNDSLCDSAYRLAGGNVDHHPLAYHEPIPEEAVEYYQVDFVVGRHIENLSADTLYAQQDRLLRFVFVNNVDGITDRGFAWPNETIRDCVDVDRIRQDEWNVEMTFTVAESCENVTVSAVTYRMSGERFNLSTVDQQELAGWTRGTFGPGEHRIAAAVPRYVVLPDAVEPDEEEETAD